MSSRQKKCTHPSLVVGVSPCGAESRYTRPDWKRRVAAETASSRIPKDGPESEPDSATFTFPAAIALPNDDLALNPNHPPQSFRSWHNMKERNKVTCDRKTLYVARPRSVPKSMTPVSEWIEPAGLPKRRGKRVNAQAAAQPPKYDDVLEYLRAFYHGFE